MASGKNLGNKGQGRQEPVVGGLLATRSPAGLEGGRSEKAMRELHHGRVYSRKVLP